MRGWTAVIPAAGRGTRLAKVRGESPKELLALGDDPGGVLRGRPSDVGLGIDHHRAQLGVLIGVAPQQQDAGLGRDGHAELVRQLDPARTFEPLLLQEDLDEALQLPAIPFG